MRKSAKAFSMYMLALAVLLGIASGSGATDCDTDDVKACLEKCTKYYLDCAQVTKPEDMHKCSEEYCQEGCKRQLCDQKHISNRSINIHLAARYPGEVGEPAGAWHRGLWLHGRLDLC